MLEIWVRGQTRGGNRGQGGHKGRQGTELRDEKKVRVDR